MKNYLIECNHYICIDSYKQGELENINNFDTKGEYVAKDPTEAIQKHLFSLGYNFNRDCMQVDKEQYGKVWYSILCDVENSEATNKEKIDWQNNKLTLYSNDITLFIYKLTPAIV